MTPQEVEALAALAARWEAEAVTSDDDEYSDRSDAYRDCAASVRELLGNDPKDAR